MRNVSTRTLLVAGALAATTLAVLAWPGEWSSEPNASEADESERDERDGARRRPRARAAYREDLGLKPEDLAPPYGEEVSVEEQRETDALLERSASNMREIELRFQHELQDPAWAEPFSMQFRESLIASGLHPTALRGIECRTTMCRVELIEADGTVYNAASQLFGGKTKQAWIRWDDAGSAIDVYVVRAGHETGTINPPGAMDI
jgi:hypothetical protein